MKKYIKKFMVVMCAMIIFCSSVSALAATLELRIYTNDISRTSATVECSGNITFEGANSIYSTNDLYVGLYEDTFGIDPYLVDIRLQPGTGEMGAHWHMILNNFSLGGTKDLYIRLEPVDGFGCYGGGKLTY